VTYKQVEQMYWRLVEGKAASSADEPVVVYYGNDVESAKFGSAFPDVSAADRCHADRRSVHDPHALARLRWNLKMLPHLEGISRYLAGSPMYCALIGMECVRRVRVAPRGRYHYWCHCALGVFRHVVFNFLLA